MTEKPRVVVGYDGSPEAGAALAWAARTAGAQDALLCVRVVASAMDPVVHSTRALADLYANRRLAHAASALADLGIDDADLAVVHGPVFPSLLEQAGRDGTIVLGSEGHGLLGGMLHGSVSQEVVRYAHGPVVVVRACEDPDARRIVVGVDGWPASRAALHWAAERAVATDEELLAVTVVGTRRGRHVEPESMDRRTRKNHDLAVLRLRRELAALSRALPGLRCRQETCAGDVRDLLVSRSRHASLLVLGSTTHDPLIELALGSVAQDLLARALCPVALVRGAPVPATSDRG